MELLAPGGDVDCIKAAVAAGADAVYCGLQRFNARNRATNITFETLGGILALAHRHRCKVYITLNTILVEHDLVHMVGLLNRLVTTSIDGVIVQDLGLLHLLATHFPMLEVHASTQMTTHNRGQLEVLARLGVCRANLSRELSIDEIRPLVLDGRRLGLGAEVFVHGSYCISFSGICYMSSVLDGHSGNRGRCSQPCRDRFVPTPLGEQYPLNLKDNSAFHDLPLLAEAGVCALKIEGRMKQPHYVYTVTNAWRARLRRFQGGQPPRASDTSETEQREDDSELYSVFNRGFSNGYLRGEVSRKMYSDHARNNSADHMARASGGKGQHGAASRPGRSPGEREYAAIARRQQRVQAITRGLGLDRQPLRLTVRGADGAPLTVAVESAARSFEVRSKRRLARHQGKSTIQPLNREAILAKFRDIDHSEHRIERLDLSGLPEGLFLPYAELTTIKRSVLATLAGRAMPPHTVELPRQPRRTEAEPALAVLVSWSAPLDLCRDRDAELCVALPSFFGPRPDELAERLRRHPAVVPWFPAVLVGPQFDAAVKLLRRARPPRIVTDNSGIGAAASEAGIPWVAGPRLNIANSMAMTCLQQTLGCDAAVVSHELGLYQLKRLRPPAGFRLHYSLLHPLLLLSSRQCLLRQVTGCDRPTIDDGCMLSCQRQAAITDLRGRRHLVHKAPGDYPALYAARHFFNPRILSEIPRMFDGFLIDLRDITTETRFGRDKRELVRLFERLLAGEPDAGPALDRSIENTTNSPYAKGF